jgi:hypothetical protein
MVAMAPLLFTKQFSSAMKIRCGLKSSAIPAPIDGMG